MSLPLPSPLQSPPAAAPPLEPGEVRLFLVPAPERLPEPLEHRLRAWLTAEELARLARFRFPRDATASLLARALVRGALGQLTGLAPGAHRLELGSHGRPELCAAQRQRPLSFNVSHTRGLVALAVSAHTVGVDVEAFATRVEPLEVGRLVFSPRELEVLAACGPEDRQERFRRLWTLKEAYIKARGLGLALPLREVTCGAATGGAPTLCFGPAVADTPERWHLHELRPTPAHWCALAVELPSGTPFRLVVQTLREASV